MSVIASAPKWQIELWDDIFEKMRGPYDSWQATLNLPPEFNCNEKKQEKWKISITKNWIRLHCPQYKKNIENLNFEKISQIALEAIAQTVIMNEYEDTLSFQRFFGKSPFKEIEDEAKVERSVEKLELETSERIRVLSLWKERPDLFLNTDYYAEKRMQDSPIPMVQRLQ